MSDRIRPCAHDLKAQVVKAWIDPKGKQHMPLHHNSTGIFTIDEKHITAASKMP